MRPYPGARWLACAIATLCLFPPVSLAAPKRLADCARFAQHDRPDEDGVDLEVSSTCDIKLSCSARWTLKCAPGSKKTKKTKSSATFSVDPGQSGGTTASAEACGLAGWEISEITWRCEPDPE